jgi:uncharacterized membrane protein YeiB
MQPDRLTITGTHRQVGYDLARALAIFGMVIVNFKVVMGAETAGPAWLVWLMGLLDGRAAATFVILAGVGISLMTRSVRQGGDAAALAKRRLTLLKRAAFLFFFGLLYTPIWPADILHFYGLYLLVGAGFLTARDRTLWIVALFLAVAFELLLSVGDYERGWEWSTLTYTDFWTTAGMLRHLFFNGFHPVIPWAAFLLVGMWLGRQAVSESRVRRRLLCGGLTAAVLAELASHLLTGWMLARFPEANPTEIRDLCGTAPMPPTTLYLFSAGGTALVLITVCVSLAEYRPLANRLLAPLIHTGQLSLTLYVAHVVIGMGTLDALGCLEQQKLTTALGSAVLFFLAGVLYSTGWRRFMERGPLEWLLRRLAG